MIRTQDGRSDRKAGGVLLAAAFAAAGPLLAAGVARADTFDNPVVAAPVVNNGIAVDGSFSDWGAAGSGYTAFGPWNQWWDGSYDYPTKGTPKNASVTTSRLAINTATNRLMIGVQTNEPNPFFELNGLFGGTTSLEGQQTNRTGVASGSDGTQFNFSLPGGAAVGTTPITFGQNEVWRNGAQVADASGTAGGPVGLAGAYQFDGTTYTIELSIPVKRDWTSADASAANTYDLSDLNGVAGGDGNVNVAYNISDFYQATGYNGGDAQGARFDEATGVYGNSNHAQDFWSNRGVDADGTVANTTGIGGLTLVGTPNPIPEPAALGLLGLGGLALLGRRRRA